MLIILLAVYQNLPTHNYKYDNQANDGNIVIGFSIAMYDIARGVLQG